MKKILFLLFLIILFISAKAQNEDAFNIINKRGEIHFSFIEKEKTVINNLSEIISIDRISETGEISAYANSKEFKQFLEKGYTYKIIPSKKISSTKSILIASVKGEMQTWNRYPIYPLYLEMMSLFQANYPELCKIDTIGYSLDNRLILCAKISNSEQKNNPEFFYSSTMHGDEVTGYVLMLRLIDYLLSNYNKDVKVTNLINSVDIYINPNANPDGTYFESDTSIYGAKRYNANNVDLNRNFPDPFSQKSIILQPENEAMINYMKNHNFVMSANIHGGAEIMNFPWDSYYSIEKRPTDSIWWINISKQYVDSCRIYDSTLFFDTYYSGITYGGDWYKVSGGRQDYVNAILRTRELTMEISSEKILPSEQLPLYWESQYKSFLNYIERCTFGIQGKITDSLTGEPLKTKIRIENHDDNESFIYSTENGYFHRPIQSGIFDITFSAEGYDSKTIKNVSIEDFSSTFLSVELKKAEEKSLNIYPNPAKDFAFIKCNENIKSISLYDLSGKMFTDIHNINQNNYTLNIKNLRWGIYIIIVETNIRTLNRKIMICR